MVKISQERDELVVAITGRESDHSLSGSGGRTGIPDIMIFSLFTDIKLIIKSHRQQSNHTYFFTEFLQYMERSFAGAVAS